MKAYRCTAVLACAMLTVGAAAAGLTGGSASDPLISRSYAETTYLNQIGSKAASAAERAFEAVADSAEDRLDVIEETTFSSTAVLANKLAARIGGGAEEAFSAGSGLSAGEGAELVLLSGSAGLQTGRLFDLTNGQTVSAGGSLTRSHRYLAARQGAVVGTTSRARVRVSGDYLSADVSLGGSSSASGVRYTKYADALAALGLLSGGSNGYELDRVPNRAEGLVMLLRLMGVEREAAAYPGSHPFKDVPAWASHYVAYAYDNGLTSGQSRTQFGSSSPMRANDYATFLLRALGWNDSAGEFSWATALDTAVLEGILTAGEQRAIEARGKFYRDDMVYTSYNALHSMTRDGLMTLSDRLLGAGVFTVEQLMTAEMLVL